MGSSSNNFFAHYVTQSQSHEEKLKSSGKTGLGNFSHIRGKPVARGKPIQAITIRLGKTPRSGKTETSDFSKTKGNPIWTVLVAPGENPPCLVKIFLHEYASKKTLFLN
jgi:hypothetical protein